MSYVGQRVTIRLTGPGWYEDGQGKILTGKLDTDGDFELDQVLSDEDISRITRGNTIYAWRAREFLGYPYENFTYELVQAEEKEEMDKELGDVLRKGFNHMDKGGYTITVTVENVDDLADVLTTLVGQTNYEDIKVTPGE